MELQWKVELADTQEFFQIVWMLNNAIIFTKKEIMEIDILKNIQ
jgi:hypothetical protein